MLAFSEIVPEFVRDAKAVMCKIMLRMLMLQRLNAIFSVIRHMPS